MDATDKAAIRALITAQFATLRWDEASEADWPQFEGGFLADAVVVPAARPARLQPVDAFVARMRRLKADRVLRTFAQRPLAIEVMGYGAVAVALAGCEITENGDTITRDVSAFLLVRSDRNWRIAAQGWDAETAAHPFPPEMLATARAI